MAGTTVPFNNPFKGKRALFRQLADAKRDLIAHDKAVTALVKTWRDQAGQTGIVLAYETRTGKLRWRATRRTHHHQRVLEFDSEEITHMMRELRPDALCLFIGFEHRRARLNALIAIARSTVEALERYASSARALEQCAPPALQTSLTARILR